MKKAQELRVDEFSVQKLRESHDTIQRLTSQLQSMQEQMDSMSDSGEFQEVESNHSGRLSYVSSQPAMVPSSSLMLSRDKRLPFDTWKAPGFQENVFGNHFSTFGSPGIILKEFTLAQHQERQGQFHKQQGRQGPSSHEMTNKIEAQFRCRHLQEGRRL